MEFFKKSTIGSIKKMSNEELREFEARVKKLDCTFNGLLVEAEINRRKKAGKYK